MIILASCRVWELPVNLEVRRSKKKKGTNGTELKDQFTLHLVLPQRSSIGAIDLTTLTSPGNPDCAVGKWALELHGVILPFHCKGCIGIG